ncbi:hypothetical protein JMJ77_0015165 [Colletotrichum scovillei]|uniref:Uncharacterized protein n=1 Tax=Colletotrichum scovillei TaxID=1209932 RepID=A0A9P7R1U2_9PEZI|nr:hypothetical protein JMJ77_0015165 [Colletotrichum scovillei]KAG7056791.1 hypothetical protein JMJ78_0000581 [Colletotrichum scovillei]
MHSEKSTRLTPNCPAAPAASGKPTRYVTSGSSKDSDAEHHAAHRLEISARECKLWSPQV